MKKTFLKFVFAVTMGISLFSWKSIGANVNAEPSVDGTNISMACNETYTFTGTNVSLKSGSSIKLDGKTITPIGVGESVITVDTVDYTVSVSLPSDYIQVEYATFPLGAYIDTGVIFSTDNIHIKFNYAGGLVYGSFGTDNSTAPGYVLEPNVNGELLVGHYNCNRLGSGLNAYKDKTLFDLNINEGSISFDFDGVNYSKSQMIGTSVSGASFYFGHVHYLPERPSYSPKFVGKLYDLLLEENNITLRNYTPCYSASLKKVGFYDAITNTFIASKTEIDLTANVIPVTYQPNSSTPKYYIENNFICLNSSANFQNLDNKLVFPNGTILTGTISGQKIVVGQNSLNLENIFGQMSSGTLYQLQAQLGDIIIVFRLMKSSGISDVYVTSNMPYEILCQSKRNIGTGNICVIDGENTINETLESIHVRGNNFGSNVRSSFAIKLSNKQQLLPGVEPLKKYNLIGLARCLGNVDGTYMTNQVGYTLYQQLCKYSEGINYTMINLHVNGKSFGLYMLTEKVEICNNTVNITKPKMVEGTTIRTVNSSTPNITTDEQKLLDTGITEFKYCTDTSVTSDGGFIIEAGYYYSSASSGFKTSHGNIWEIKDPEYLSLEQITKIASYTQEAEDALFSETGLNEKGIHYSDIYDLDSIARDMLVRSFMLDHDLYNTSNYLYIDGDNDGLKGKMFGGPVWDLDMNYLSSERSKLLHINGLTMGAGLFRKKIFEKGDFVSILKQINETEFEPLLDDMFDSTNQDSTTVYSIYSNYLNARAISDVVWGISSVNDSSSLKNNLISRNTSWRDIWFANALRGVTVTSDGVRLVANAYGAMDYQWYKIDDSNSLSAISGATLPYYTPSESGAYCVIANGQSLAGINTTQMTSNVCDLTIKVVHFNMNGHGEQISDTKCELGTLINKPDTPYETGYTFKGWYKEAECTNRWIFSTDVVTEDMTLYAKWVQGGTLFKDTSISLKDNTWLNMYTECIDDDYTDYKFTYSLHNAANPTESAQIAIESGMFQKIGSEWRISVALKPDQMADVITIYMYDLSDHLICTKTDSIRSYAMSVINSTNPGVTQAMKDACIALLNYGAAVQQLTGYNSGDLANKDLPVK